MRRGPFLVCAATALLFAVQYFVPHPAGREALALSSDTAMAVASLALLLGAGALAREHAGRIRRTEEGWGWSAVTLAFLAGAFLTGLLSRGRTLDALTGNPTLLGRFYARILSPLEASLFATLGFFLASAACRRLRFRGLEASAMAGAALLLIAGRVPFVALAYPRLGRAAEWVMAFPAAGAGRGLLMGIALGVLGAALRLIRGIDRPYEGAP